MKKINQHKNVDLYCPEKKIKKYMITQMQESTLLFVSAAKETLKNVKF